MNFMGKVALVTGGSSGMGRAAAIALAKIGAKVIIAARREDKFLSMVAMEFQVIMFPRNNN